MRHAGGGREEEDPGPAQGPRKLHVLPDVRRSGRGTPIAIFGIVEDAPEETPSWIRMGGFPGGAS